MAKSVLSRLASAARSFVRRRTGGLGTQRSSTQGEATVPQPAAANVNIIAPPIEAGGTFLQKMARALELIGKGQRVDPLTIADLEQLLGQGQPPIPGQRVEPPQPGGIGPPPIPPPIVPEQEEYDDIEILGRDLGYDVEDFGDLQRGMIEVSSSNVFSYYYQPESKTSGILYVTFLAPAAGKGHARTGPGPTYAYYGVTRGKFQRFKREAEGSPGSAVWDHLRVRGSVFDHQVQYRLISVSGDYVPRKATAAGFRTRWLRPIAPPSQIRGPLPPAGPARDRELRRRGFQRSTLPERAYPDRGTPDRGTPNRG